MTGRRRTYNGWRPDELVREAEAVGLLDDPLVKALVTALDRALYDEDWRLSQRQHRRGQAGKDQASKPGDSAGEKAEALLLDWLKGGGKASSADLKHEAEERGISTRTLQRTAKALGVLMVRDDGHGSNSYWSLPTSRVSVRGKKG